MPPVRQALLFAIGTAAALVATAAIALPGPTACALVGMAGLNVLGDGIATDSKSEADHRRYIQLVRDARARIEVTFGTPESRPIVVIFNRADGFGPFKLNGYGSTQMVGSRACVMVGPKGQNIDVVAHELMHGELHYRVGPLQRFMQVPTWFDEGIAMQVDYRSRYLLPPQEVVDSGYLRTLTTASSFFVGDDEALTRNYASAKAVVASWVATVGPATLYPRLLRLKSGESFSEVVPELERSTRSSGQPSGSR
jgi:hypothetical protein